MDVYVVYKTDNWHSPALRDLLGVASSMESAIALCREQAKKEGKKLKKQQRFNLRNIKQTQGYSGDGEFDIDVVELDVLQ